MPAPTRTPNIARATTSGPRACSRSAPGDGKIKWGFQYTPERSLRLRRNLRAPDHQRQDQRRGSQARGARGPQRLLLRARPHQRLVRGRQAICRPVELDDRPRSEDRQAAQLRSHQGRAGLRRRQPRLAREARGPALPVAQRRQELGALERLQSRSSACSTSRPSKAATRSNTVEQKSFVDQGGTVNPRERFAGGDTTAIRPATSATAASRPSIRPPARPRRSCSSPYPNYGGVLATAGNLVFIGQPRRHVLGL